MNKKTLAYGLIVAGSLAANAASANVGVGVRAGTFGFGAEFDIGLLEKLNLRLGYNTFSYDETVDDTDVRYDGTLKINSPSAIFDWHPFGGGFRLSFGAVGKGPKIDITGTPAANNTYEFNGHTYTAAQIGSASGTIKMGDSTAPYIGIGWGNTVDKEDRVTFLFDIGAIHTGSPKAELRFTCNPAIPPIGSTSCSQFQNDIDKEKAELEDSVKDYEWWPVISLGLAVRF